MGNTNNVCFATSIVDIEAEGGGEGGNNQCPALL